jgi:cytochrome c oxidase accessory protein FixG
LSKKNRYDLDPERLSSTDEFGNRVYIYPEDVQGKWKKRRFIFYWFLVFLYLVLPWIYINGKPSLMINIANREFTLMGFTLYGMEPILFFLLLISGLFFVAFLVSKLGRVWCGWGCPQTVFIQAIFLKIEALIEGKARERILLDEAPWRFSKIFKKILKWILFFAVASHIAHTFIGYFVGPRELFFMTMHSPMDNWGVFIAVNIITLIFLLDFGWFREQFCIIACPYGRIQSVLMDENSQVVAYDTKRGEPRRGTEGIKKENEGDCVNCYSCVKVCPTGIDIRRGVQLECIACTQCIDACDDIMQRVGKAPGLIRYSSEVEMSGGVKKFTLRPYLYIVVSLIFISTFIFFLNRSTIPSLVFIRGVGKPFLVSETEGVKSITNKFTLKIKHQGSDHFPIKLEIASESGQGNVQLQTSENPIELNLAEKKVFAFFKFDKSLLVNGSKIIKINVYDVRNNQLLTSKEVTLVGPVD